MQQLLGDVFFEALTVAAMAMGSVLFTIIGFLGEQAGLANLLTGDPALGAWEVFVGTWALFVGIYLLGLKQVLPRIRGYAAQ